MKRIVLLLALPYIAFAQYSSWARDATFRRLRIYEGIRPVSGKLVYIGTPMRPFSRVCVDSVFATYLKAGKQSIDTVSAGILKVDTSILFNNLSASLPDTSDGTMLYHQSDLIFWKGTNRIVLTDASFFGSEINWSELAQNVQDSIQDSIAWPRLTQAVKDSILRFGSIINWGELAGSVQDSIQDSIPWSQITAAAKNMTDSTIQGLPVVETAPSDNYILKYDQASSKLQWEPDAAGAGSSLIASRGISQDSLTKDTICVILDISDGSLDDDNDSLKVKQGGIAAAHLSAAVQTDIDEVTWGELVSATQDSVVKFRGIQGKGISVDAEDSIHLNIDQSYGTLDLYDDSLSVKLDGVDDRFIDWGTGSDQVNSDDIPEGSSNAWMSKASVDLTLCPEYPGACLYATDTTKDSCDLIATNTGSSSSKRRNYYQLWSENSTLQQYGITIRFQLPTEFSSWDSDSAITIWFMTEYDSADSNKVNVAVYEESGSSADATSTGNHSNNAWSTIVIDDSALGDLNAAEEYGVILLTLYSVNGSKTNNFARVGDIRLRYNR